MGRTVRWTEDQLKNVLQQKHTQPDDELKNTLKQVGLGRFIEEKKPEKKVRKKKVEAQADDHSSLPETSDTKNQPSKKKQGVQTKPIFDSLLNANYTSVISSDKKTLCILMDGARVLTYNELYSILQYRKYEAFKYKKLCRAGIEKSLSSHAKENLPYFNGPTRLSLVRRGSKEIDLDATPVVFKYFIDTLKRLEIIDDDNPNTIVDIQSYQEKGEHQLMMKLERLDDWEKPLTPTWNTWVGEAAKIKTDQPKKNKKHNKKES